MCAGLGMALAARLHQADDRVWVIIGDGEAQEGSIWEAAMAAAAFQPNRSCLEVDFIMSNQNVLWRYFIK